LAASLPALRLARYRSGMCPRRPPINIDIDIEASGFGAGGEMIEIGVVMEDGRGCCSRIRHCGDGVQRDARARTARNIYRKIVTARARRVLDIAGRLDGLMSAGALSLLLGLMVSGCATNLSSDSLQRLNGSLLYGRVNRVSQESVKPALNSDIGKMLCAKDKSPWCSKPDQYTYVSVIFMNTYWGGLKGVGVYAPLADGIQPNDIVVIRFNASRFSEMVRIASRGNREGCGWVGGGFARATTSGGVVCEDYHWGDFAPLFGG